MFNLLGRFSILSLASTAVTAVTLHIAFPIIFSLTSLGLSTYTIYRIYQRSVYQGKAQRLEQAFELALQGKFQAAHDELTSQLHDIISLPNAYQRITRLYEFSTGFPYFSPRTGQDGTIRGDFLTRFYYHLIILTECEKIRKNPSSRIRDISYFVGSGSVRGIYPELQFLNAIKTDPTHVTPYEVKDDIDVGNFLWNAVTYTFIHDLSAIINNNVPGWHYPQYAIDYVSYLAEHFPSERFNVYKQCRSLNDFYRTALTLEDQGFSNLSKAPIA